MSRIKSFKPTSAYSCGTKGLGIGYITGAVAGIGLAIGAGIQLGAATSVALGINGVIASIVAADLSGKLAVPVLSIAGAGVGFGVGKMIEAIKNKKQR